jgi:hypothetical protein
MQKAGGNVRTAVNKDKKEKRSSENKLKLYKNKRKNVSKQIKV